MNQNSVVNWAWGAVASANTNNPDLDLTYSVVDIDLHLMNWFA